MVSQGFANEHAALQNYHFFSNFLNHKPKIPEKLILGIFSFSITSRVHLQ
jgi:hypothetical protein